MTNPTPFTSAGYPFRKDLDSYEPHLLGRAFFSDGFTDSRQGFELFDNIKIINNPVKDEPVFYKKKEIKIAVYTTDSKEEFTDKYKKLALNYNEIGIFLVKDNLQDITASVKLGNSLLDVSNFKNSAGMQSASWPVDKNDFSTLAGGISAKSLITYLNSEHNLFDDDIDVVTGISDAKGYQDILDVFKELEDDYGAGYMNKENPHAYAHGDIELKALASKFKPIEIEQIYYGNWLRDFSQVIVAATVGLNGKAIDELGKKAGKDGKAILEKVKKRVTHETWVKVIEMLAVHEFVYKDRNNNNKPKAGLRDNYAELKNLFVKNFGELTKDVLGIYRPEEHIDNPKGLKDESKSAYFMYEQSRGKFIKRTLYHGEDPKSLTIKDNMKYYILNDTDENRPAAFTYFSEQMRLAKAKGRNKDGFRHFGAALHILEDYYAHTNFIELALIKHGDDVYPWVELTDVIKKMKPGPDKAAKIPVVTGLFSTDDTIASIAPKIAAELFPTEIKKYEARKPGDKTFFDTMILTVLTDYADKERNSKTKTTYAGLTYQDYLNLYNRYLAYLDRMAEFEKIPVLGWLVKIPKIMGNYISQLLSFFPKLATNLFLNSVDDAIKEEQTQLNKNYGSNPSHTQLAKDPEDHPLNELSALLAIEAVKMVGTKMKQLWQDKNSSVEPLLQELKNSYFIHPSKVEWMDEIIKIWKKDDSNKAKIKRSISPSLSGHIHKEGKQLKKQSLENQNIRKIYEYFKKQ